MKILKIALFTVISSVLMVLPSNAKEVRIGVAASLTGVTADGTETMKDSSKKNTFSDSETTILPSVFFELATDNGFGLGVEHVPGSADISAGKRTRTDDDEETTGNNTASAEVDGLTSIYLMKTFSSGFFVKAGQTSTTINTNEVLATGSVYGNVDVDGQVLGFGYSSSFDSGLFLRASAEWTDYDDFTLISGTPDATTATTNTIKADVDTTAFKLAIGKAF